MTHFPADPMNYFTCLKCTFLQVVDEEQCQEVLERYADNQEDENEHQDYFNYVMDQCGLSQPHDWREGLALNHDRKNYANSL